jgi:signal transduction histidine kinase
VAAPPASVSNTLRQQRSDNIYLETQNVSPPVAGAPVGNLDLSYLADASLELGAQLDTRIRVLDVEGRVLVDSMQMDQGTDLSTEPVVAEALQGAYGSETMGVGAERTMHVAVPVTVGGRLAGVVYLSQSMQDVVSVLGDVRLRWLASMLVSLLLSGAVGLLLSRAVARPVQRLTRAVQAVAEGQLDQRVPVHGQDELAQLSHTFNDMTERLQTAHQMQVDFVANVSHELRTPLTSVKGLVETLRGGAASDQVVRDRFLSTIEGETDRLIRLVNDLLLLSRVDSEALVLRREDVDVVSLVDAVVEQYAVPIEAKKLSVRVVADGADHLAFADPDRVTQILLNLLDNAIKYSYSGGEILVRVRGGGDLPVTIAVCDQGVGIPADVLPRIGERFFRADKARARTHGGSGLGLAIAHALVRAHGGRLWVESRAGKGTTVQFTLAPEP